ncbi:indolepyruvate ferredoxin oxidoreductase family protein [Embleya scabrispora]|uniref:indolepyruvate ferredoxin oxidoreductase family protein n=1 Tax=Embleya scabrispora TaxID=159449 RepID=UPI000370DFBA|nr:indolepyruvate ferredoxin oxidoreductase family protein [Embleya scabrispora]MYS82725.1 indolepyruvate ferredoxin oxidoreductase family protein [Streptomyces sp. SID5474]
MSSTTQDRAGPDARFTTTQGRVLLSGVQALVRLVLDQRRADAGAGADTGAYVSGYQGSPLGTIDLEFGRQPALLDELGIVFRPGVNEELAATAIAGSQLAAGRESHTVEGVLGVWYGKSPGVDRAADAIRHGNLVGTGPTGGVLMLVGDDPAAKSSTVPGASEALLAALGVPVFSAGDVQELLDLGRHAIACSRESGLWVALKVVTRVADATATVEVGGEHAPTGPPAGPGHRPDAMMIGPRLLNMERDLVEVRLARARAYGRRHRLTRIARSAPTARVGVITAGTAYFDLCRALEHLGVEDDLVRVLKVGMIHPLDAEAVREFAVGLDEVLVLEEKGPFLEPLVKEALYGAPSTPPVTGKHDPAGAPLVPLTGVLDAGVVGRAVAARLLAHHDLPELRARAAESTPPAHRRTLPLVDQRTPFFCSGCPHNVSTKVPAGTLVGAGIGCHGMVTVNRQDHGDLTGLSQMGGEGAHWIGMAPFLNRTHLVQNMGDGTFAHSGSLAIRAAVSASVHITFKLLYNDAVAMTGGQQAQGRLSVPAITRLLEAEGVRRIVVTTEDVRRYRRVRLAGIAKVRPREHLEAVQAELAAVPGVTVLIHDQLCAIEKRRRRRRGELADPVERVLINESICEGCGDCGAKSGCLSVEPVQTEFGRKTRIHQSSCTKDFSCLQGDCPAFLTVRAKDAGALGSWVKGAWVKGAWVKGSRPGAARAGRADRVGPTTPEPPRPPDLPLPRFRVEAEDLRIRLVGIGGTGVVTVAQVLGAAAALDGLHTAGLDQTGLSQKAGPVVSDVRISTTPVTGSATVSAGSLDLLLGLDILGAASAANLANANTGRTVAVVCTGLAPTGRMATDVTAPAPDLVAAREVIDACTRERDNVHVDARDLAERVFGDHLPANVIMLGAAWQHGMLPITLGAIEEAFRRNGTAVEQNLAAFGWGRAAVAEPAAVQRLREPEEAVPLSPPAAALVDRVSGTPGELRRLLSVRVPELIAYQHAGYARRYVDVVAHAHAVAARRIPGDDTVAEAVARGLFKLMAYKDEYEVARLHLAQVAALPADRTFAVHLHPPVLRALGMDRKIRLGPWSTPLFRALYAARPLRGTRLDPFGPTALRRTERELIDEYVEHVRHALDRLTPATRDVVVELCELPDTVRGYEEIKLAGVARFRDRARALRDRLAEPSAPPPGAEHAAAPGAGPPET